jgi:hypothetical protein
LPSGECACRGGPVRSPARANASSARRLLLGLMIFACEASNTHQQLIEEPRSFHGRASALTIILCLRWTQFRCNAPPPPFAMAARSSSSVCFPCLPGSRSAAGAANQKVGIGGPRHRMGMPVGGQPRVHRRGTGEASSCHGVTADSSGPSNMSPRYQAGKGSS